MSRRTLRVLPHPPGTRRDDAPRRAHRRQATRRGEDPANLALACIHCNSHKGPNLTGIDPASGEVVRLFNPREAAWDEHFALRGAQLIGLTPTGRATVYVLAMNHELRLNVRKELIVLGLYL